MLSADQALQNAKNTFNWTVGMCDNFVANMYGYSNSGYDTALVHWQSLPSQDKHPGDMNAPAGALMFWGGGNGHVAISDGNGGIYSTDIPSSGVVSNVSASYPGNVWRKPYLGWSTPYFQGDQGQTGPPGSPVQQTFSWTDPFGIGGDIEGAIGGSIADGLKGAIITGTAGFGSSLIKWSIWIGEFLMGLLIMGFSLYLFAKGTRLEAHVRRGIPAASNTI